MLRDFSGTAFDPALVDLLIARLNMTRRRRASSDETRTAPGRARRPIALQDIAGAHREEQTLYEIAQALGSSLGVTDAMALIQEKVSRLVPFTTCALFLGDDERRLRLPVCAWPRHRGAVQVDAEVLERPVAAAARPARTAAVRMARS